MITAHLTDAEIQLYIVEPENINDQLTIHVQDCENCQANIANYRLLFNGIQDQVKPRFDFDLTNLVLEQLPEPKRAFPWAVLLISVFSVSFILLLGIFFWSHIEAVITRTPMVLIATAIAAAIVILIFQAVEMIRNHQKQLHALLNVNAMQL
ncbi:MAG: hypothetical protein V4592_09250 [Bacteroidota bacterium]